MYQLQVLGFEDRFPKTVFMSDDYEETQNAYELLEETFFQMEMAVNLIITKTVAVDGDTRF